MCDNFYSYVLSFSIKLPYYHSGVFMTVISTETRISDCNLIQTNFIIVI